MSGHSNIGASVGYGIPQAEGPTLTEAEAEVTRRHAALDAALAKYRNSRSLESAAGPEIIAHRAQVLANLAGEFVGVAYNLQRAAYDKATK